MPSQESWVAGIKKTYDQWKELKKPSYFEKYSTACATYLCSPDFQRSEQHWFCQSQEIHNYAIASLLMFAYDSEEGEAKERCDIYARNFAAMLKRCTECRISYQCSIEGLIEMLITEVKIKPQSAKLLLKEFQRRDRVRLASELVESVTSQSTLTEIMWSESCIIAARFLTENHVIPGSLSDKSNGVLDQLQLCPGFITLAFSADVETHSIAFDHISSRISGDLFRQAQCDDARLFVFRRMLLIGLKRNVQAVDKADIAWFRAAKVLQATQKSPALAYVLIDMCIEELKISHLEAGLGVHYLLLIILQILSSQKNTGTLEGGSKNSMNDLVQNIVSKSPKDISLSSVEVDIEDSSPLSTNHYRALDVGVVLKWFKIWCSMDSSPDELINPARCLMNTTSSSTVQSENSAESKILIMSSVFDLVAKFPRELYKPLLMQYKQSFLKDFTKLNSGSIVSLWQYQCSLQANGDSSLMGFWEEALISSQFARYSAKSENVHIISNLLKVSLDVVIPPLKNPEHDKSIRGEDIIKGMLESVLDIAAPSTLVNVLQDKLALKTLILMWTRQDAYISLVAEESIKQTLDNYSAESAIGALVHSDPLILIEVMSMIQEEASQAQIAWLKLIPGICKLSLMTLDEIYAPRDGIDTSYKQILESLLSFWKHSWLMCDNVLKNIRKWCTQFDVIQMLSATLEYCKGVLSKFRLLESEFTMGLHCDDEKSWGSILITPAITCVNNMGDLLKLNLPNLLAMALSVIVEILDYMRYFKVTVPSTLKVLIEDLSTGKKTSRLDENQIRELLTTCGTSDTDIAFMLELKRTGKGRKDARLAPENSQLKQSHTQRSSQLSNSGDVRGQQQSMNPSTKAQSSIGDFFKLSNGLKPPIPPQRTVVNNTIVPKTQHSTGISAVRAQLEQSKSTQGPRPLPPKSKFGVIHPERPPGFNIPKKSTSATGDVDSTSSDDENDDDDDDGGALSALGAKPKNVDEASAKLREAYSKKGKHRMAPGLITNEQMSSRQLAKSNQEKEEQMMKKRLSASPESMYKVLLGWDYFASSPSSLAVKATIPNKFESVDQYKTVMTPLLYLEAWELIKSTKNNLRDRKLFNFSLVFGKRVKVDDYADVYVSTSKKALAESGLQDSDLLVIGYDPKRPGEVIEPNASIPHCFAKVKEGTLKYSKEFVDFQIRMLDNHSFLGPMVTGSIVSCFSVGSVTTLEREFTSLIALPYYNLLSEILTAKPAIADDDKLEIDRIQREQSLNKSQATAVSRSMHNNGFSLIQGPPGTGKTKTIISIIGAYFMNNSMVAHTSGNDIALGKKILVCAPSNAAVDEIVLRLRDGITDSNGSRRKLNILRLGRIDKVSEQVKDLTLDSLTVKELSASAEPADDQLRRDHTALLIKRNAIREKLSVSDDSSDALSAEEVKKLEAELKAVGVQMREKGYALDMQRERLEKARKQRDAQYRKQQNDILSNAQVVCTTLSASSHPMLVSMAMTFETVIVDEAAQSIELSSLIPMKYGCKKCIMVGDPNQLPPTVLSQEATRLKYNQSLFVRMFNQWKDAPGAVCMLDTQFRMHPEISKFPSKEFYKNKLKDAAGLTQKLARPWHNEYPALGPYSFFNIQGKHERGNSMSLLNHHEAKFALQLVQFLISKYPDCGSIGLIAPYKEQVNLMRRVFLESMGSEILSLVDFNSVDGFQGQEKDIIIMSCVRASDSQTNSIGFLSDVRRLNVAITRAKTSLWILGRSSSLMVNSVWSSLIEDAKSRNRLIESVPNNFKRSIEEFKISSPPAVSSQVRDGAPVKRSADIEEAPLPKRKDSDTVKQDNGSSKTLMKEELNTNNKPYSVEADPKKSSVVPNKSKPPPRIPQGKKPPSLFITKRKRPNKRPGGA